MTRFLLTYIAFCTFGSSLLAEQPRPNVVLLVTDDQGYGDMQCHGNPWLQTPHLDELHRQSLRLTDYHVDPVCTPTRAALITGRYCNRVGAWAVTEGRQLLAADETTIADVFSGSGYRTAMIGKWHLGDVYPYAPRFRGFEHVVRHMAGGVDEIGNPEGNNYFDDHYFRNGVREAFTGYCTDIWFDETIKFIGNGQAASQPESKPFFLYLPTNAMHGPFTVAEKYSDRFVEMGLPEDRAKFFGMIENFDENLGRLNAFLRKTGQFENTLLIFMGDNGTAAGSNGKTDNPDGFNAGMRGKKGSVYEGGHRVACFARWPARWKDGRDVDGLTTHRDWLPTLMELCHLSEGRSISFDGQSMVPLFEGDPKDWPDRTLIIDRQADTPRLLPPGAQRGQRYPSYAVLTRQWRMVNGELYDILKDPSQKRDVASDHAEVRDQLWQAYRQWYDEVYNRPDPFTRFLVGHDRGNPTLMTVRDWHPTEGRVIWKPAQLSDDALWINGFWAVEVHQPGRYRVRLSRHPEDAPQPMKANRARLKIGEFDERRELSAEDTEADFTLELPAGKTLLSTWLTDAKTGRQRGAYFVSVQRLTP